ncbi:MAG: chorismate--pyruvate lyase [Alteromonadaceae bacterium]
MDLALMSQVPLSLEADWRSEPSKLITTYLSSWLFEQGSLTSKLKRHCSDFKVKILAKHQRNLSAKELTLFGYASDESVTVQVREVLLYCDGNPWVYAQTLMPLSDIPPAVVKLTTLGEKPLGEVIFNEPGVIRSAIEVAEFDRSSEVVQLAAEVAQTADVVRELWARRSMFTLEGYSLLVAEVFLPDAEVYQ